MGGLLSVGAVVADSPGNSLSNSLSSWVESIPLSYTRQSKCDCADYPGLKKWNWTSNPAERDIFYWSVGGVTSSGCLSLLLLLLLLGGGVGGFLRLSHLSVATE